MIQKNAAVTYGGSWKRVTLSGAEATPGLTRATETSNVRDEKYPYRGQIPGMDDYDKLDVEEIYLAAGATVLRWPMVYGPNDGQRREDVGVVGCQDAQPRQLEEAGVDHLALARAELVEAEVLAQQLPGFVRIHSV